MKLRIWKIYIVCLVICMGVFVIPEHKATAASAKIGFFTDTEAVEAGQMFTLTLEITADATIGGFEAYFTYNSDLAEYNFGPSCITGGEGYLKVSDLEAAPSSGLRNYVMYFTARNPGMCTFQFQGVSMVYAYEDGNAMSLLQETCSMEVTAAKNASDNAMLSALRISPGTLQPEFSPEITEYSVNLENTTSRLIVSAVTQDMNAKVSVSGQDALSVGENHVNIVVEAENGSKRVYHIFAVRGEKGTKEPEVTQKPQEAVKHSFSVTETEDGASLFCGSYQYRIAEKEGMQIPEEYRYEPLLVDGEVIPAYMTAPDAEFCLLVLENEAGEKGLYRFDRKEYTVQRFSPEVITITESTDTEQYVKELLLETKEYEKKKNQMSLLCGAMAVLVVLLAVCCLRLLVKNRGYSDDELD